LTIEAPACVALPSNYELTPGYVMHSQPAQPNARIRSFGKACFVVHLGNQHPEDDVDAALRAELLKCCAGGVSLLVLDVSDVTVATSATLGLILLCRRLVLGVGGHLRLAGVRAHLRDVLHSTRLAPMLDCRPDLAAAIADHVQNG
jgi:anti-anti-sigma factor